jgi:BirA family biotin operon repressor/biotin-[acetyl-CoA-carboxylase] ligase
MKRAARDELLATLADGGLHSGAALAARLGVSRTAVWKLVAELNRLGVGIASIERRGYHLAHPCEALDEGRIGEAAAAAGTPLPGDVEVLFTVDSTNEYLYAAPVPRPGAPRIVFAELQQAGRGRRGRTWTAPFGSGLTFSIAWSYAEMPADLSALGLALGVQVAETLRAEGVPDTLLKWPNDIVWRQRKLGGLLLQLRLEAGGAACVVAGLGLNLSLPAAVREQLEASGATPVADVREASGGRLPGRNRLAGRLAGALCAGMAQFGHGGYAPFAARWRELDSLQGAAVRVTHGGGFTDGRSLGADRDGALLVEVGGRTEKFLAGDVSLRPVGTPPP